MINNTMDQGVLDYRNVLVFPNKRSENQGSKHNEQN